MSSICCNISYAVVESASLKTVVEQCLVDAAVNLLKHVLQVCACQHDQHIKALQLYIAEKCSRSFQPGT